MLLFFDDRDNVMMHDNMLEAISRVQEYECFNLVMEWVFNTMHHQQNTWDVIFSVNAAYAYTTKRRL